MSHETDQPPIPPEVDLKDFPYTGIFRSRLFGSSFHAHVSDAGWRAGVTLWLKSWDQMPSGSLPDDDVSLCRLAEFGRDQKAWLAVKTEALWGWDRYIDGRLYHSVVTEGVLEAWNLKIRRQNQTEKARSARLKKRDKRLARNVHRKQPSNPQKTAEFSVTETVTTSVTDSVGTEHVRNRVAPLRDQSAKSGQKKHPSNPQKTAEFSVTETVTGSNRIEGTLRIDKNAITATQTYSDKPNSIGRVNGSKFVSLGSVVSGKGNGAGWNDQSSRDQYAASACVPFLPGGDDGERWGIVMAAEDPNDPNHGVACRQMLKASKAAGVGWVSPARRGGGK